MKSALVFYLIVLTATLLNSQENSFPKLTGPYPGQKPPGMMPEIFVQGILTSQKHPHGQLAFSPDGKIMLWSAIAADSPEQTIYFSTIDNDGISQPEIASFAEPGNGGPAFTTDGKRVYFSTQLTSPNASSKRSTAICFVERNDSGWSKPVIIKATVDTFMTKGQVTVARNGNIYFSGRMYSERMPTIYISRFVNGSYHKPEKIRGPLAATLLLVDPWINPEERYMLFSFPPDEGPPMLTDIGISFPEEKGDWSSPLRLNKAVNTDAFERFPIITQDGKYLFFIRSYAQQFVGDQPHFYWVSTKIIDELKPKE